MVGVARQRLDPRGTVLVRGEYWTATSEEPVEPGEPVEVVGSRRPAPARAPGGRGRS